MNDPRTSRLDYLWEQDTSLADALAVLGRVLSHTEAHIGRTAALEEHGLDPELLSIDLHLDAVAQTLVVTGLQALGLLDPNLRELIAILLDRIDSAVPEVTPELQEKMEEAVKGVMQDFQGMAEEIGREIFDSPNGDANAN